MKANKNLCDISCVSDDRVGRNSVIRRETAYARFYPEAIWGECAIVGAGWYQSAPFSCKRSFPYADSACQAGGLRLDLVPMKRRYAIISMACFALLGACKGEKQQEPVNGGDARAAPKVRFKTNKGDFVLELNAGKAPVTVANFLKYVNAKHYDGTVFHRVIDGFMIQGGGFALDGGKLVEKKSGEGIKNEGQNGLKNDKGTIAMARTRDPNSATAQFFINVGDNAMLNYPSNGGYAVFGKVIEGMDVVEKIKGVKTASKQIVMRHPATGETMSSQAGDVPVEPVVIESATVVE